jgi:hypothetical protein
LGATGAAIRVVAIEARRIEYFIIVESVVDRLIKLSKKEMVWPADGLDCKGNK